jgi:hypothetical protein
MAFVETSGKSLLTISHHVLERLRTITGVGLFPGRTFRPTPGVRWSGVDTPAVAPRLWSKPQAWGDACKAAPYWGDFFSQGKIGFR